MQKDVNFFSIYHQNDAEELDRTTVVGAAVILACLIAVISAFCFFRVRDFYYGGKASAANAYLSRSEIGSAEQKLRQGESRLSALKQYASLAQSAVSGFSATTKPSSDILSAVAAAMPSDVTVVDCKYADGAFTLECSCTDQLSPANFIHRLRQDSRFLSASYSGAADSRPTSFGPLYFTATFSIHPSTSSAAVSSASAASGKSSKK